jgi:hypothetical protein
MTQVVSQSGNGPRVRRAHCGKKCQRSIVLCASRRTVCVRRVAKGASRLHAWPGLRYAPGFFGNELPTHQRAEGSAQRAEEERWVMVCALRAANCAPPPLSATGNRQRNHHLTPPVDKQQSGS